MQSSLYASFKVMENNQEVTMTSLEVIELINKFREEEGNETEKRHDDFLRSVRKELETLVNAGIDSDRNFTVATYQDKQGKQRKCYNMTKAGIMQMLNKESALVRYKTQQYIEALENRLKQQVKPLSTMELLKLQYKALEEQDLKIEEVKEELKDFKGDIPLFQVECKELQALVRKIGTKALGGYKSPAYNDNSLRGKVYSDIQNQIKREFDVNRYEAIKRCQFDSAMEIVSNYRLPYALEQDIKLKNMQLHLVADNVRQISFN
ncbi:MAG: ORF6C domain-containing protein [Terrisporobacter othiniensis]|uniref:ORF6C domain-containing protein n=1 Tax=Terrisporobacter othiniensis TaxID=1577792 RepID=UPI00290F59B8|nr:ORF6C domain-containing protein [Terrisporobacter othiniensis]MDU6984265.1 ORF6C domain-containing protein [Terrisporobacter othiniensis]